MSLANASLLIGDIKGFGCLYSPLLVDLSAETDVKDDITTVTDDITRSHRKVDCVSCHNTRNIVTCDGFY